MSVKSSHISSTASSGAGYKFQQSFSIYFQYISITSTTTKIMVTTTTATAALLI